MRYDSLHIGPLEPAAAAAIAASSTQYQYRCQSQVPDPSGGLCIRLAPCHQTSSPPSSPDEVHLVRKHCCEHRGRSDFRSRNVRVHGPTTTGSNKTDGRCGPDPGSVYWFTPRGCSDDPSISTAICAANHTPQLDFPPASVLRDIPGMSHWIAQPNANLAPTRLSPRATSKRPRPRQAPKLLAAHFCNCNLQICRIEEDILESAPRVVCLVAVRACDSLSYAVDCLRERETEEEETLPCKASWQPLRSE